jgi:hypothetical protein
MDKFEHQLSTLLKYVRERLHPEAFVMYHPEFLTVAHFDGRGSLSVIADSKNAGDRLYTFSQLYAQVNDKIENLKQGLARRSR